MNILLGTAAIILSLLGIVGAVLPILPGAIFSFAALLCAYLSPYSTIEQSTVWLLLIISIAASILDYFLPIHLTKKFGGSKYGVNGATIGVIAGIFLFPPFGMIILPMVGAVVGELIHDSQDTTKALRVGVGSFLAFILGSGMKLIIGIWIAIIILSDMIPAIQTFLSSTI